MKTSLPRKMTCPSCGREQPIRKITIDQVLDPSDEEIAAEEARIDVLTEEFSDSKGGFGVVSVAHIDEIYPKPGEALRDRIWKIRCSDCDPEGGYYWLSLDRCNTPRKALDWIMHFNHKAWPPVVLHSFIRLMERLFGRADS